MTPPLLSIITVTKNCVTTLDKTLRSVAAVKKASLHVIEYIVIDGVSTDGTLDLLRSCEGLIDRLISEPDTGIYNAMNKGITLASGSYVLFINGDDELVTEGFPDVLKVLQTRQVDILCSTTLVGSIQQPTEILVASPWRLPFFNSIPHPSAFVSASILRMYRFREDLRIVSDYDFFLRSYLAGIRFMVLPVVTALHQRGGASGNVQRSIEELKKVRLEVLGWRYPLFSTIATVYRLIKLPFRMKNYGRQ